MGRSFKISVCFSDYISINTNLMARLSVVYITISILHCEEDFFKFTPESLINVLASNNFF